MATDETSAVATDDPEQTSLSNIWRPEVEDDVESIDIDQDDRGTGSEFLSGSSQSDHYAGSMAACPSVDCSKHRISLEKRNGELHSKIRSLQTELRKLRETHHHKNKVSKRAAEELYRRAWPEKLRRALTDASGGLEYAEIYKLSCYEENVNPRTIHPVLAFKAPSERAVHREARALVDQGLRARKTAKALRVLVLLPRKQRFFLEYRTRHSFSDLPIYVRQRIFKLLFSYPDKLIHAISRLDQFVEPATIPPVGGRRSGLLNRFHITGKHSGRSCSLTYAIKGNDLLAPFLVSRQFLFLGAHAFYGCNTFAFSSLGEFGRFSSGIGTSRRQRLQHVELLWIGSQAMKMEGHSRRTWALAHLCDMVRLRSLTMYIDESHVRRKQEGIVQMAYLARKTSGQPDFRMSRNLRTVQGIDYVRQLRGLRILRVLENKTCEPVRDWSFLLDLEMTCKRDKPHGQHQKSLLKNLLPLLRRYSPSEWEWQAVESHYDLKWNPEKTPENETSMMSPVAGDAGLVSNVVGIGSNGLDADGNTAGMGEPAHAAESQANERDIETAGFDLMNIDETSLTADMAQVAQDQSAHPPPEPGADVIPGKDHGVVSRRSAETEADESLFVEHSSARPPSELSVDFIHENSQDADHENLAFETASKEGLSFAGRSAQPRVNTDHNINPEGPIDEPPDCADQNLEFEARGKTPKSELWVGIEPDILNQKPHEQDDGDGRAESEDRTVSPEPFEMRPRQGTKRPPLQASKHPPSQGGKHPSHGEKRLPSQGGKRLPYFGLKLPHMSLREDGDSLNWPSAGDEGSFYPEEESDANVSTLAISPERDNPATVSAMAGIDTRGSHGTGDEDDGMNRTDEDVGESPGEQQDDTNSRGESNASDSEDSGADGTHGNEYEKSEKQRDDVGGESSSNSDGEDGGIYGTNGNEGWESGKQQADDTESGGETSDSEDESEVVEEQAFRKDRTEPLTSTNKGESSDKDASGENGDGTLETRDHVCEAGGDENGNEINAKGHDCSEREDVESGDGERYMNDNDKADHDDCIDPNTSNNERDRVTRTDQVPVSPSCDGQTRNGSSPAPSGSASGSIAAIPPPDRRHSTPRPGDSYDATLAYNAKKRKRADTSPSSA